MTTLASLPPAPAPEERLERFAAALQRLRAFLGEDHAASAAAILSDVLAVQLLHQWDLYAVTGTQGAGKTTLLAELYGDEVAAALPTNAGRGERIPVAVVERDGCTTPVRRLHRLAEANAALDNMLVIEDVDPVAWNDALRGAGMDVVLAELSVPPSLFNGGDRGFLLLPGYERLNGRNDEFQQRMRRAQLACGAFVLVTDHTRLAQDGERAILDDLRVYLDCGAGVVVAVSKTEGLSDTERAALRESAREVFSGEDASPVVVATGAGADFLPVWRQEFLAALETTGTLSRELRLRQLDELSASLGRPLNKLVEHARTGLTLALQATENDLVYLRSLEWFDTEAERVKREASKEIGRALGGAREAVRKEALAWAHERSGGFGNALGDIWDRFTRNSDTSHESADKVRQLWQDHWTAATRRDIAAAAHTASARRASALCATKADAAEEESSSTLLPAARSSEESDQPTNRGIALPAAVHHTLSVLNGHTTGDLPDRSQMAYELLPAMALAYLGLELQHPTGAGEIEAPESSDYMVSVLTDIAKDNKAFLAGFAGIIGLDLALDGDLDTVRAVSDGLSALLLGKAGNSAMLPAAVAITAVASTVSVIRAVNRTRSDRRATCEIATEAYANAAALELDTRVDDLLAYTRERLDRQLQAYYKVGERFATAQRGAKAVADVESERDHVLELVRRTRVRPI